MALPSGISYEVTSGHVIFSSRSVPPHNDEVVCRVCGVKTPYTLNQTQFLKGRPYWASHGDANTFHYICPACGEITGEFYVPDTYGLGAKYRGKTYLVDPGTFRLEKQLSSED